MLYRPTDTYYKGASSRTVRTNGYNMIGKSSFSNKTALFDLDDLGSINHFPEEVQNSLILISEWLCNNDKVSNIYYR